MLSLSEKMQASTFLVVYSVVVCFLGVKFLQHLQQLSDQGLMVHCLY